MFGRRKNANGRPTSEIGLLGQDTCFEGQIRFAGTLRIDGTVVGDIVSEEGSGSMLVVNQQASVQGNITADAVLISGKVEGDVVAAERVEIFRSGHLKGDVYTGDIMIEGGAEFEGFCHMSGPKTDTAVDESPARRKSEDATAATLDTPSGPRISSG